MVSAAPAPTVSKPMFWTGCVLSALPVLGLVLSGVMKVIQPPGMADGFEKLGWPLELAITLAVIELTCTLLYVIPQTSVLGAILLTGYLGGATATHLRIHEPWFPPVLMGVLLWLGLYLRDPRIRALAPLRKPLS